MFLLGTALHNVMLFLTTAEAAELKDSLESLLNGPADLHHHVSSSDFSKELTVCVYSPDDPGALAHFDDRSKRIILTDT